MASSPALEHTSLFAPVCDLNFIPPPPGLAVHRRKPSRACSPRQRHCDRHGTGKGLARQRLVERQLAESNTERRTRELTRASAKPACIEPWRHVPELTRAHSITHFSMRFALNSIINRDAQMFGSGSSTDALAGRVCRRREEHCVSLDHV
jgi:hypothetical protein